MLLLVLALVVPALSQDSSFHNTGTIYWKDCGAGHKWVSIRNFNISPSPVIVPGDMTVTLDGSITHHLANSVSMDVTMQKKLLGRWTRIPCNLEVGTCHYTDPCHFLNAFASSGHCPTQLEANGLPCTCPFNPSRLHLPSSKFTVTSINAAWQFLAKGDYHIKIAMNDKHTHQVRGCVEAYLSLST